MSSIPHSGAATEAAEWFTRLRRQKITTQELYAFRDWRQDPANDAAYSELEATWSTAGQLAEDPDIKAATAKVIAPALPRPSVSWSAIPRPTLVVGLACVAVAAGASVVLLRGTFGGSYATRIGEQRLVVLQDGSRIRLNTDSQVRVRLRDDRRDVELTRGEAFFEPTHNTRRPFVVTAGEASVRATGTRFDVRRNDGAVQVTLVEGQVDVRRDGGPATVLSPAEQLTVTADAISSPRAADTTGATSWTSGRLIFRGIPLADALAEVNRYAVKKIVLDGEPTLAQQPVSGVFDTGDTKAFVAAVDTLFDLQARPDAAGVTHLTPKAPGL